MSTLIFLDEKFGRSNKFGAEKQVKMAHWSHKTLSYLDKIKVRFFVYFSRTRSAFRICLYIRCDWILTEFFTPFLLNIQGKSPFFIFPEKKKQCIQDLSVYKEVAERHLQQKEWANWVSSWIMKIPFSFFCADKSWHFFQLSVKSA